MAVSNQQTVAHIYKRKYSDGRIVEIATRDRPTFYMMRKKGGFTGTDITYMVQIGFPQGIAGTLTAAQAACETGKGVQFRAYRRPKYAVIRLDGEAMAACKNDGAFVALVTKETNGKIQEMGANFAFDLQGEGDGLRGRRASISTNTVTLSNPHDVPHFKLGMTVMAAQNADGSSPRTGTAKVVAIDPDNGTITLDDESTINTFSDNDYLFRSGDPGTCMEGMEALTPLVAPVYLTDDFRDVDRGQDVRALAGTRQAATGIVEDDMGLAAVKVSTLNKSLTHAALHPINFWKVVKRGDAKVMYDKAGGKLQIGFQYIELQTPAGQIKVYSDPDVRITRARMFNQRSHYLHHLEGLPHIIRTNGDPHMQMATADTIEIRGRGWVNYIQDDPSEHAVVEVAA